MLGYILVLLSLALGLVSGADLPRIASYFFEGLVAPATLQLLAVVTIIEMLTELLEATGSLERIMAALRAVFRDSRMLIALVPSLLGLFPVPGGAMLSAPMVGKYGDEMGLHPNEKAAVNLFFRHVWDQVFPFKSHLILAATVVGIPMFTLIGWQLPVTLATLLVGFWYLVGRRAPRENPGVQGDLDATNQGRPLWVEVAPLLLPLVLTLGFRIDFAYAMAAGLLFGLLTQGVSRGVLHKMVVKGVRPRMLFIIAAVMVFKTMLEGTGVVKVMAEALTTYGVSVAVLAFVLPMMVGVATGIELVAVAMVFPLVAGLVPTGTPLLPYVMVMMLANAVGQTLSPVHMCMVVGNEYFGARFARVVQMNLLPQLFRLAIGLPFAWAIAIYLK